MVVVRVGLQYVGEKRGNTNEMVIERRDYNTTADKANVCL